MAALVGESESNSSAIGVRFHSRDKGRCVCVCVWLGKGEVIKKRKMGCVILCIYNSIPVVVVAV